MAELEGKLIGELLGLIAHDLRNPLSALHSNAGFLMSSPDLVGDNRGAVEDALVSCDALSHIIQNLGLMSYLLSGKTEVPHVAFDPSALIEEVVDDSSLLAASHGTKVEVARTGVGSARAVTANRDMALRALENILHNSIQHGAGADPVLVRLVEEEESSAIVVQDSGSPLAAEAQPVVFSAQGQLSTKTMNGGRYGRGLGLFSARVAADAAGAKLSAAARTDAPGTVFELRFRYA